MESEKYICIRETGAQNTVVIVDMAAPMSPARRQISADSALMCPDQKIIALKAVAQGTPGDNVQVFNLDTKTKLKAYQMADSVEYWKWVSNTKIGLVTATAVYHWDIMVRAGLGSLGRKLGHPDRPTDALAVFRRAGPGRPREGLRPHAQPAGRADHQLPRQPRRQVVRADRHHGRRP